MKKFLFIILLSGLMVALPGVIITHTPPMVYPVGSDVAIQVEIVSGLESISRIYLGIKPVAEQSFLSKQLTPLPQDSLTVATLLSAQELAGQDLEYYFDIELIDGVSVKYPDTQQDEQLFTLKAETLPGKEASDFILLSTQEDFSQDEGYILAVSYFLLSDVIDVPSIEVWVNGKNVTRKAVITSNTLVYQNRHPKPGTYEAVVTATTKKGDLLKSPTFITNVSKNHKAAQLFLNGSINFAANIYNPNSVTGDGNPGEEDVQDDYKAWLDLVAKYGVLGLNANLLYSSFENPNQQPVSRYRFGAQLPSMNFQWGDYSPHISPFVMSNHNIRGLYGKIAGKYLSLEGTVGEIVRKTVAEDSDRYAGTSQPAFQQEAIGGRIRMGSETGLSLGFNFSRNRDIISSLSPEQFIYYDPATADTLFIVAPQDNAVVSIDTKLHIPWLGTDLGAEVAGSLLNRNTWFGPITSDEIGEYFEGLAYFHPEDLAGLFVINKYMEPLLPGIPNCAGRAYLRTRLLNNLINANITYTGPAFNALSTWSQEKDTRVISVTDMFNIGNSFFLSGGYVQHLDNYSQTATDTNFNTTWFVNTSLRFIRNLSLRGGYYNMNAYNEDNTVLQDSLAFTAYERKVKSWNVTLGYQNPKINYLPYLVDLTFRTGMDQNTMDSTLASSYLNNNSSLSLSLGHKFGLLPLRLNLAASFAVLDKDLQTSTDFPTTDDNLTLDARASYPFLNNMIVPYLNFRYQGLGGDQTAQTYKYFTAGLEATPWKDLSLRTDLSQKVYTNASDSGLNSHNLIWSLTVGQRF